MSPPPPASPEDVIRLVQIEDTARAHELIRAAVENARHAWVPADCILAALLLAVEDLAGRKWVGPSDFNLQAVPMENPQ